MKSWSMDSNHDGRVSIPPLRVPDFDSEVSKQSSLQGAGAALPLKFMVDSLAFASRVAMLVQETLPAELLHLRFNLS